MNDKMLKLIGKNIAKLYTRFTSLNAVYNSDNNTMKYRKENGKIVIVNFSIKTRDKMLKVITDYVRDSLDKGIKQ